MASLHTRITTAATRQVDIASLAAFRIIFGTVMFAGVVRFLLSGQLPQIYGLPKFFFTYPGFHWVTPWPVWGMYVHYSVLAILALMIALGAWYRVAAPLFTLGFAYTQLVDITNYLNHHYLVVLVGGLLGCVPAHRYWSIDAWRRPALRRTTVPAWIVWVVRFQIGVVYVFAGLAKAKVDWLGYGQPLNLWLSARVHTPLIGQYFDQPLVALAMSWGGFLFDSTIVIWLLWRRTRVVAYLVVIGFHGMTGYLFNIGMFPLIMTSAALIFFSYSWPRLLLGKLGRDVVERDERPFVPSPRATRVASYVIALHATLQIALPLRHLAYPGEVLWNEDGMRFAWHVMIREKHGSVTFVAKLADGRQVEVPPSTYLTWRQEREMGSQPDLILQLARHIGADLRRKGLRDFTLHAETAVSLNGRPNAPMIDPRVDLLSIQDLGPRDWVLPAPTDAPPKLRPLH